MKVVGVDPGGRSTGIVLRSRDDVEAVEVIVRDDEEDYRPGSGYLAQVLDVIAAVREKGRSSTGRWPIVAVEDLHRPTGFARGAASGHRTPLDPAALIGVAVVLGAVLGVYPDAIVVPPGKNGSHPLPIYPQALIGGPHNERWPRAEPAGTGVLRHARSAWDVAGNALFLYAQRNPRPVAGGRR